MANRHVLRLHIFPPFCFGDCSAEIIEFNDSQGNPALEYGKDGSVLHGHIIRFESGSPFLFISYAPTDWQPCAANHGPVIFMNEGGSNRCVTIYSRPVTNRSHVLELAVAYNPDFGEDYPASYRIAGLEQTPAATPAVRKRMKNELARLKKVVCPGRNIFSNPALPTVHVKGT